MIRASVPKDTPDLQRLCIAQFLRTPWPEDGAVATDIHVHIDRRDGMTGAVAYARQRGGTIYVIHVWTVAGFAGKRAGVALLKDLANMADAEDLVLTFTVAEWNRGLRAAVERHDCLSLDVACVEPTAVFYAREPQGRKAVA
jgi:hypothetical protein